MKAENTPKPRNIHPDRLTINEVGLCRINSWIEQIETQMRGIRLSRGELVNWLILNHSEKLTHPELKEIEKEFFDEVKFASWALRELKAAKARGETKTLSDLVSQKRIIKEEKPAHLNERKKSLSIDDDKSQLTESTSISDPQNPAG